MYRKETKVSDVAGHATTDVVRRLHAVGVEYTCNIIKGKMTNASAAQGT